MIEPHPVSVNSKCSRIKVHAAGGGINFTVEKTRAAGSFFLIFKRTPPIFKTNNIDLTNLSMKQHQTRQLFNETTLILPTFQWNNANLSNQPLSILSFFLQTKRNCWTCFFPDSRQCCTMGKTPSCLLLILALDKKRLFPMLVPTLLLGYFREKKIILEIALAI